MKVNNPTLNSFELLAQVEEATADVERKENTRQRERSNFKDVEERSAPGKILTPAEKSQARRKPTNQQQATAEEGDKSKQQESKPEFAQKDAPLIDDEGFSLARNTRARPEKTATNRGAKQRGGGAPRGHAVGDAGHATTGTSVTGGSGPGTPGTKRRDEEYKGYKPRGHHHQPPAHGREFDKHSAMNTGRQPIAKKGGAGKGNWGTGADEFDGQPELTQVEEADVQSGWGDDYEQPNVEEPSGTEQAPTATEPEFEGGEIDTSLDSYYAQQAQIAAELQAKIGPAPVPRKVESDISAEAFREPPKLVELAPKKEADKKTRHVAARKGEKAVSLDQLFEVHAPPIIGGRGRGRGRGTGRVRGSEGGAFAAETQSGERGRGERGARGGRGARSRGRGSRGRGSQQVVDSTNTTHFPVLGPRGILL